jgi:hypothetical protein
MIFGKGKFDTNQAAQFLHSNFIYIAHMI